MKATSMSGSTGASLGASGKRPLTDSMVPAPLKGPCVSGGLSLTVQLTVLPKLPQATIVVLIFLRSYYIAQAHL